MNIMQYYIEYMSVREYHENIRVTPSSDPECELEGT